MSLMLDVDGLGTCMAHPRRETPTCERVRRRLPSFEILVVPLPQRRNRMESSAQGFSQHPTSTAPQRPVLLGIDQCVR